MLKFSLLAILCFMVLSCSQSKTESLPITSYSAPGDPIPLKHDDELSYIRQSLGGQRVYEYFSIFRGTSECSETDLYKQSFQGGSLFLYYPTPFTVTPPTIYANPREYKNCNPASRSGSFNRATTSILSSFKKVEDTIALTPYKFERIYLNVAPLIKERKDYRRGGQIDRVEGYAVNNAYYNGRNKAITFLPQGFVGESIVGENGERTGGVLPFSGIPLWNIPFVPAHEYGHHVFNSTLKLNMDKVHTCFDIAKVESIDQLLHKPGSKTQFQSALNEGFADVFAQVSIGKSFTMSGINCFERNRDVNDDNYMDGRSKEVNESLWSDFVSPKRRQGGRKTSCNDTNPALIHTMGAAFARGFYKAIEGLNKKDQINILLRWLELMKPAFKQRNSKDALKIVLKAFDLSVQERSSLDDGLTICSKLMDHFSLFQKSDICN